MTLMKKIFKPDNLPRIASWLVILIVVVYTVNDHNWTKSRRVIISDVMGYYLYLPATFIYHDLSLDFISENPETFKDNVWFLQSPTGKKVIQYTTGMAILYSPFFLVAHGVSSWFGFEPNGYTAPYKIALLISCLFYFGLALYYLRKILLRYYSPLVTAITIIIIGLGTNLLHYLITESTMTHAYNFSFLIFFIYLLIKWLENPTYLTTILLGFITGMIGLIRPTNALIVILFILWGVGNWKGFINRLLFLLKSSHKVLLMLLVFFIVWVPQFLYWKYISGSWLYFSYGDRAWFFFEDPEIINILFSYRKGWLLYTPVMIFALIGIPLLYKYAKEAFLPVLVFTILNLYILASWCFWWYGGSFGLRAFVDSYGLLAIPLAAFVSWSLERKLVLKIVLTTVLGVFVAFNVFQHIQFRNSAIHFVSMTKEAYWETFLKLHPTEKFYDALEFPDYNGVEQRIIEAKEKRKKKREKKLP